MKGRNYPSSIGIGCQLLRDGCSPKAFHYELILKYSFFVMGLLMLRTSPNISLLHVFIVNGLHHVRFDHVFLITLHLFLHAIRCSLYDPIWITFTTNVGGIFWNFQKPLFSILKKFKIKEPLILVFWKFWKSKNLLVLVFPKIFKIKERVGLGFKIFQTSLIPNWVYYFIAREHVIMCNGSLV